MLFMTLNKRVLSPPGAEDTLEYIYSQQNYFLQDTPV